MRLLKRLGLGAVVLVALFLGIALFLGSNTSLLRGPITRAIAARLKRTVSIDRIEEVQLFSLHPHGVFAGVTVGNPPWAAARRAPSSAAAPPSAAASPASDGHFVRIGRARLAISALPLLLRGVLVLPYAEVQSVDIRLLRDASNRANWRIGSFDGRELPDTPALLPVVQNLSVKDAHVELVDEFRDLKASGTASTDRAAPNSPTSNGAAPKSAPPNGRTANSATTTAGPNWIRIQGRGETTGRPFSVTAIGQPVESMRTGRPYQLTANIVNEGTQYEAAVTFDPPFELNTVAIDFSARGPNLAEIYYLTHVKLPNTGDYQLSGHLKRDHDLLTADLTSKSLDLPSAAGPPKAPDADRLFPQSELNPDNLRRLSSRIHYHADAVHTRKLTLKDIDFRLEARHGVLTIEPASLQLADGHVTGKLRIDATKDDPDVSVDARVSDVNLAEFHPGNAPAPVEGKLFGRAVLHGHGRSAHEVAATAGGSVTAVVPRGEIRQAFAELAGSDIVKGLGLMIAKDQGKTEVRCGVAQFKGVKGTLVSQSLVFDTDDVLITGKGEVDLGSEIWDLSLSGAPKKVRLFRLRAPIEVRGPLLKPSFNMKTGNSLGQGAAALGLAALLTPVAAILPFVDPGLAKNADCSALLSEARQTGQDAAHNR